MIFKMFKNNMKFTRAACLSNWKYSWYSYLVTIVGHYYAVIIKSL